MSLMSEGAHFFLISQFVSKSLSVNTLHLYLYERKDVELTFNLGKFKCTRYAKKISQNFDKNNKIDCLFLFEIIKKTNSLSSHLHF